MKTVTVPWSAGTLGVAALLTASLGAPCVGTGVQAQQPETSGIVTTFGIGVSANYYANRDELVSPRPYSGRSVSENGLFLSLETSDHYHELNGWLDNLDIASDDGFRFLRGERSVPAPVSEVDLVDVSYTYLHRLDGPWWLGVAASAQASHTKYELGVSAAEGFLYVLSLGLSAQRDVDVGPGRSLRVRIRVPIVGWLTRPTYSTVDEARLQSDSDIWHRLRNGEPSTMYDLRGVHARVGFGQGVGSFFGFRLVAHIDYQRNEDAGFFESLRAGFDLGIFVQWPGADR